MKSILLISFFIPALSWGQVHKCDADRALWEAKAFFNLKFQGDFIFVTDQTLENNVHTFKFVGAYPFEKEPKELDGFKGLLKIAIDKDGRCALVPSGGFEYHSLTPYHAQENYSFTDYTNDTGIQTPHDYEKPKKPKTY